MSVCGYAIHVYVQEIACEFVCCTGVQVSDTLTTAEVLLGDLAGFESFSNEGRGLGEELREYQREQLDQWSRQTLAAINHSSEPLRSTLTYNNIMCTLDNYFLANPSNQGT